MTTVILENVNDDILARFQEFAKSLNVEIAILDTPKTKTDTQVGSQGSYQRLYNPPKTFHQALLNIPKLEGYSDEEIDEIFGRPEHYSPHREIDWGSE